MRKIVAGLFMSLDGVVESPARWLLPSDEMWTTIGAGIAASDAVLLGRRTYLEFAALWPPQGTAGPMATFLNTAPKYVASTTLRAPLPWQPVTIIATDLTPTLMRLKRQAGKSIQVPGSPRLVRWLLREGLLDELSLMIHPVVLGAGLRLFEGDAGQMKLEVTSSRTFGTGVLSVTYRPQRA